MAPQKIITTLVIIVLLFTGLYAINHFASQDKGQTQTLLKGIFPSVSPVPFEELTIPYLRQKTYESKLGALSEVGQDSGYTSYLTSYDSEGLKINGLLNIPGGQEPQGGWPAIVFVHGYLPPDSYDTQGEAYSDYVDYLARNGFVVFKIDLRGHGSSEGLPGGGYFGADYVTDILNAYSALQSTDFVNPEKIGMWGHSMAGNAIMRSAVVKPTIPAVVIWAGAVYSYTDQRKYGISDGSYRPPQNITSGASRRQSIMDKVGSPSAESDFWRQMAPIYYLTDLKGAVQIHHAIDDPVVNIGYSRDLNTLMDKTTVVHELHEYPTGEHNISGNSFVLAMERTVDFFKKHLQ